MIKNYYLTFMHGTLQRSKVWDAIISQLNSLLSEEIKPIFNTPDLYHDSPDILEDWIDNIANKLPPAQNILTGYSLGGRLALEIYKKVPQKITGMILVSTDPGLENDSIKEKTLKHNEEWSKNFLEMRWEDLVKTWGEAKVFSGIQNPIPPQSEDFDRQTLSKLWAISSKAKNPSNWPLIPKINIPTLVITGSLDTKFDEIGKRICELNPAHTTYTPFPNSAHRVPWEDSTGFCSTLAKFIENLHEKE